MRTACVCVLGEEAVPREGEYCDLCSHLLRLLVFFQADAGGVASRCWQPCRKLVLQADRMPKQSFLPFLLCG